MARLARLPLGAAGGPRPARGAAPPFRSVLPSPPASPGRECLVPAAPSPGPEGRAGRAVSYPLLLPASSPPRCGPRPPLTHAAPGLARRWVWAGEGLGSRAESGLAGATWRPRPSRAGAPSGHSAAVTSTRGWGAGPLHGGRQSARWARERGRSPCPRTGPARLC